MKNKKVLIIVATILLIAFFAISAFFALRGISAAEKEGEHIDVYRERAIEYIKTSPEMIEKYGADMQIEADSSWSIIYIEPKEKGFLDIFNQVFNPYVPDDINEYTENIKELYLEFRVCNDSYKVQFTKDESGSLVISSIDLI